jgi:hypothetical protein
MVGCLVAAWLLREQPLYLTFFIIQIVLYVAAVAGMLWPQLAARLVLVRLSAFFVLVNAAALKALALWLVGSRVEVWQPTQRPK